MTKYLIRRIITSLEHFSRDSIEILNYCFWLFFDFSKFKIIKTHEIESLLFVGASGPVGDTYIDLGTLNNFVKRYPKINVYVLNDNLNRRITYNPKITFISKQEVESLILAGKIDSVVLKDRSLTRRLYSKIKYRVDLESIHPKEIFKKWPLLSTRRAFPKKTSSLRIFSAFNHLGFPLKKQLIFHYNTSSEKFANNLLKDINKRIVFIHPGAGTITKAINEGKIPSHRWPEKNWAEVIDCLINKQKVFVFFTVSSKEESMIKKIILLTKNKKNVKSLAGKTSVSQAASLLNRGNLLITIDTGMAHIASQTKIPIIDLFGPTSSKITPPLTDKAINLYHPEVCSNCRKYACPVGEAVCMESITVQEVLDAAEKFLA